MCVEFSTLLEAAVDDETDSGNCDGGFCDVCGEDDFTETGWSYCECFVLEVGWKGGIERTNQKLEIRLAINEDAYTFFILRYLGL